MNGPPGRISPAILLVLLLLAPFAVATAAQAPEEPPTSRQPADDEESPSGLPGGIAIDAESYEITEDGDYVLDGAVALSWKDSRIQADHIVIRQQRYVVAEGHVLMVFAGSRVAGSRLEYDLETELGTMYDAIGQMQNGFYFWAKEVEKIGEEKLHLTSATVTTCTQPTPYWSFSVTSATVTLNRYARMWNARLKTGKMPVFYLPYLVWPVKRDRAAGLLLPEVHSTDNRGDVFSQELFIPIGKSADVTLLGRYYTKAGFGGGGTARFIPNSQGQAELSGFFIQDKVANNDSRFRGTYKQTQRFRNGFRMVADINVVSDFDYYSDFETELNLVASPTILTRLEFSRNGRWNSVNVRELRRKQLFSGGDELKQSTYPEIEWRVRSRKLGKSPFYLSFESSLANIQQSGLQQNFPIDADYLRGDFFPEISVPISKLPWLEVTPRITSRVTHYTQRQRPIVDQNGLVTGREVSDDSLTRSLLGAGLEGVGPKVVKIYDTPKNRFSPRYKHTIEPNLSYGFLEDYDELDDILVYDEVDRFQGQGAGVNYGIRSRLFAKRPQSRGGLPLGGGEAIQLPAGATPAENGPDALYEGSLTAGEEPRLESVEIATFELRQRRSFENDLSFADLDFDGVREESSRFSGVTISGRYNPAPSVSLDLRSNYDILYEEISDVSLSGLLRADYGRMRFSVVHREGLGVDFNREPVPNDTQFRLTGGLALFRKRLRLDVDGTIDFNPQDGQARIPDKSWRVTYATQCCTFIVEKLNRDFSQLDKRRDIHFRMDLRGVGKLLDHSF
jgi:LPS-assembly protein